MKSITITPPKGYEVDENKSTFNKIVFKKTKKELPKKWEDLEEIDGWYIGGNSDIIEGIGNAYKLNKNIFATKEQAEAAIALAQLSQLLKVYNDGWQPKWTNSSTKYAIGYRNDKITILEIISVKRFLVFKTKELAQQFLKNFKDLIEQAKPLL